MLKLKDLFTLLATGELSNISLGRDSNGEINESEYPKLIGYINLGLIELCKRFRLLENELLLHTTPDLALYPLRDANVVGSEESPTGYIELLSGQHSINIIEVTGIFDVYGNEIVMNNRYSTHQPTIQNRNPTPSILQVATDTLRFNGLVDATDYNIVYQAYPDKITLDSAFDSDNCVITAPDTVTEALLFYVAYRIYKPAGVNNPAANADKSSFYQQQYELSCQKIELLGLGIQNCDNEDTFHTKGWA
jgi:hypothetical protein